jgi:hypothetical protein
VFEDDWATGLHVDQITGRPEDMNDTGADGAAACECDIQWLRKGHVFAG